MFYCRNTRILILPRNTLKKNEGIEIKWDRNRTKHLIDLYGKYSKQLGTLRIKNKKQMWVIIADELTREFKVKTTPQNCENRWKVLERNYKKYIDNKNSTGRGIKRNGQLVCFQKSVNTEILLTTETIHLPVEEEVVGLRENMEPLQSCEKTVETLFSILKRGQQ
ncbi:hypothetical protein C0J52_28108 [Blattella germanica]|nr:hypothetical protein C0J52_28108 [Blattella germanica]